ncbi:thioredoxin-dependent thiol peroxidase [Candidatus Saccharibacteria bacterium]|nr:thioredoxin-dependent thiol peroxidase [Candidatus Saccharibacteria bacterium]NIW79657.1 thioredoxin-dependent thiol peroxidase [Calditrichia bacterium]
MAATTELKIGDPAPNFNLKDANEEPVSLDQFAGKWVVLYFYPKDNTSGCTAEALDFTAQLPEFEKLNAVILGVSPDSCQSHQKFINKHDLKVRLLSDPEHEVLQKYGVWQKKSMYGKEYMGVVRTTYLIDPEGKIRHIWPKVKVKGHADDVRQTIAEMQ